MIFKVYLKKSSKRPKVKGDYMTAAGCQKAAGCAPKGQVNVKQKVLWRGKYTPEATENTGVIKTFQLGLPNQRQK